MEERFYKFSSLTCFPEIVHGISNRSYADMQFGHLPNEEVIKNRRQFAQDLKIDLGSVIMPHQVHGSRVVAVGQAERGKGAVDNPDLPIDADGLVTGDMGVYLAVAAADCLPILMYDPSKRIVGVVHAGWRGIIDQIVIKSVEKFKELGTDPENLVIGIGPGICQKHFVVRNGVLKLFLEKYPSATFVRNKDGYIDLKKTVVMDLKKAGVPSSNIEVAEYCTFCDNGIYGSYRKEGENGPKMLALLGLKK